MIRKATKDDVNAMMEVVASQISDADLHVRVRENFESAFDDFKRAPTYFLLESDGKIVCIGGVSKMSINYRAYGMHSLWTHKDYERQGFASQIIKHRIEYVKTLRRYPEDDYIIFLSTRRPELLSRFGFDEITQFDVNGSKVMMLRV